MQILLIHLVRFSSISLSFIGGWRTNFWNELFGAKIDEIAVFHQFCQFFPITFQCFNGRMFCLTKSPQEVFFFFFGMQYLFNGFRKLSILIFLVLFGIPILLLSVLFRVPIPRKILLYLFFFCMSFTVGDFFPLYSMTQCLFYISFFCIFWICPAIGNDRYFSRLFLFGQGTVFDFCLR